MARRLLQIVPKAEELLTLTPNELAWALLEDMRARLSDPVSGMAKRDLLSGGLFPLSVVNDAQKMRDLIPKIDKAGKNAYALLEKWELIEPADDINGRNGYIVLTDKGNATSTQTDFEGARVRSLLREEMLHPLLQGKIFQYFNSDDLNTAIFEAFKMVEIEVRSAGNYSAKEIGKTLVFKAFAPGAPLSKPTDDKQDCDALSGLFAGALHRFRNPGAHSNPTYQGVLEAMEELMFASRLLRIIDDRRSK